MKGFFNIEVRSMDDFNGELSQLGSGMGIKVMTGLLHGGQASIQSYEFDKKNWTEDKANEWVSSQNKNDTEKKEEKLKSISKSYPCTLKNFNDEELSFEAIASTEDVDRDGDILRASGWTLKNYKTNPMGLYGHDSRGWPIFKSVKVWIEDKELHFIPKFTSIDLNPEGERAYRMYKEGFLNTFSVRFDPFKWKDRESNEEGLKKGERFGREYIKQDLLEISAVTIPSLPQALANRDFQSMLIKKFQCENSMLEPNEKKRKEILDSKIKICTDCGKCKEEKSGRVLSAKNRKLVNTAMEAMGATNGALQTLLEAAEPQAGLDSDDELDKLRTDLKRLGKETEKEDVDLFIQETRKKLDEIKKGGK